MTWISSSEHNGSYLLNMHQCIFGWDSLKSCLEDFLEIPSLSDKSVHEFYICDLNWNCCSKGWCSLQGGWGHPPRGGAGQRNTNGQLVGEPQSGQHISFGRNSNSNLPLVAEDVLQRVWFCRVRLFRYRNSHNLTFSIRSLLLLNIYAIYQN